MQFSEDEAVLGYTCVKLSKYLNILLFLASEKEKIEHTVLKMHHSIMK